MGEWGYKLVKDFTSVGEMVMDFENKNEVQETDAAYLWHREDDNRGILAFRGSDTQEDLLHVRSTESCEMYGHHVHSGVTLGVLSSSDAY